MKNLLEEAQILLLHQFQDRKNISQLVKALTLSLNYLSDKIKIFHHGKYINNASNTTLDIIGHIVDFPRANMRDPEYKIWLSVAILCNISQGTSRGISTILQTLLGKNCDLQIIERSHGIVIFEFFKKPAIDFKLLKNIIESSIPISTKAKYGQSWAPSIKNTNTINKTDQLAVFKLDFTGFGRAFFSDFIRE